MAYERETFVDSSVRKTDNTMHAAGGLGTSARDAATWILAQRAGGGLESTGLLSAEARKDMQTLQGQLPSPRGRIRHIQGYGLGWQMGTYRGRPYLNHGGGYVGAATLMAFPPLRTEVMRDKGRRVSVEDNLLNCNPRDILRQ